MSESTEYLIQRMFKLLDDMDKNVTATFAELEQRILVLEENQDTFAKKWYADKKSNTKL